MVGPSLWLSFLFIFLLVYSLDSTLWLETMQIGREGKYLEWSSKWMFIVQNYGTYVVLTSWHATSAIWYQKTVYPGSSILWYSVEFDGFYMIKLNSDLFNEHGCKSIITVDLHQRFQPCLSSWLGLKMTATCMASWLLAVLKKILMCNTFRRPILLPVKLIYISPLVPNTL